jgi:hypothetical protein
VIERIPAKTVGWSQRADESAPYLIDITGLAKPLIYTAVRGQLLRHGHAFVAYTPAGESYLLPGDVEERLNASAADDAVTRFPHGDYRSVRIGLRVRQGFGCCQQWPTALPRFCEVSVSSPSFSQLRGALPASGQTDEMVAGRVALTTFNDSSQESAPVKPARLRHSG